MEVQIAATAMQPVPPPRPQILQGLVFSSRR